MQAHTASGRMQTSMPRSSAALAAPHARLGRRQGCHQHPSGVLPCIQPAQQLRGLACPQVHTSKPHVQRCAALVADRPGSSSTAAAGSEQRPLKVLIAGAGIGGLVLAVALIKKGVDVVVFERDLTAIRGEGKYRGPIQVQSNALAALEAIDPAVADAVLREGCITGDRINGLCDGETGDWYIKFDTFHPAVSKGLPVTRVISRVTLQEILADAVERLAPPEKRGSIIRNSANVVAFEEHKDPATGVGRVSITLEDGTTETGDLLVGADGIWSKVRRQMMGASQPCYSGYTCYTGISDFTPPDLEIVGYRVFLGNGQYFVSSDVGGGKQQWYGFHKEPADGQDPPGKTRKERLLEIFGHWCSDVTDLIKATPEGDILRRDINDRPPIFSWCQGRVALLGDSAHAMQPNLGQGGCMAIEDAFQLGVDVGEALDKVNGDPDKLDVSGLWGTYQAGRLVRAAAIHGMARFAAIMASTYKAYLGEGLGPLEWIKGLQIPHPGRVIGRAVLHLTMPAVLDWVLGGNNGHLARARPSACRVEDRLKVFSEQDFQTFMADDDQILRSAHARWMLLAERDPTCTSADATSCCEAKGIYIHDDTPLSIGSSSSSSGSNGGSPAAAAAAATAANGNGASASSSSSGGNGASSAAAAAARVVPDLEVVGPNVAEEHARVWKDAVGDCWVQDLPGSSGTWVNGKLLRKGDKTRLLPQDILEFGSHPAPEAFRVKMQHNSLPTGGLNGHSYTLIPVGNAARVDVATTATAAAAAGGPQQSMVAA